MITISINKNQFIVEDSEHIIEVFKTYQEAEAFTKGMLEVKCNGYDGEG